MTVKRINFDSFPPIGLLPANTAELIATRNGLITRADKVGARLIELITGPAGSDAREKDRIATVAAIEAGGAETINDAQTEHHKEVAAARNESNAISKAIEDITARIIDTITTEAPALLDSIPATREKAHRNYTRALDALNTARAAYHHTTEFQRWIALFVDDDTSELAVFTEDNPGLTILRDKPGQTNYTHEELIEAYKNDLEGPTGKRYFTNPWK